MSSPRSVSRFAVGLLVVFVSASCGEAAPELPGLSWIEGAGGSRQGILDATACNAWLAHHGYPRIEGALPDLEPGFARALRTTLERYDARDPSIGAGKLGCFFLEIRQDRLAQECFERAAATQPTEARWMHYLGHLAELDSDLETAIKRFEAATTHAGEDAAPFVRLARALRGTARDEELRQALRAARDRDPDSVYALTELAAIALGEERFAEAEELLRQAHEHRPTLRRVNMLLARLLRRTGRDDEATRHEASIADGKQMGLLSIDAYLARQQRDVDSLLYREALAEELKTAGNWPRLVEVLEDLHGRRPGPLLRARLAEACLRAGRVRDAEIHARIVVNQSPERPEGHEIMARIHFGRRHLPAALAAADQALSTDGGSRVGLEIRAKALAFAGRIEEALAATRRLARARPEELAPILLELQVRGIAWNALRAGQSAPQAATQADAARRAFRAAVRRFGRGKRLERAGSWIPR